MSESSMLSSKRGKESEVMILQQQKKTQRAASRPIQALEIVGSFVENRLRSFAFPVDGAHFTCDTIRRRRWHSTKIVEDMMKKKMKN
ncbi:unnamed protein product [Brassica napus]|uniref:(rape) hypothetical protein n=1 Tax=Brassica napus TaxID=3708 RepID=A0A816JPJ1_BRANA|nr:unnamed protein product [Brassica napus]